MCFYNEDCEWTASITDVTEGIADTAVKCDECCKPIAPGEWRRHVYQQEYEDCQTCENDECECLTFRGMEHRCQCDKPNYGETFDYDCCERCNKVIRAVEEREKREGCPSYAQRPALMGLWDEVGDHDDAEEYAKAAIAMFPELATDDKVLSLLERS